MANKQELAKARQQVGVHSLEAAETRTEGDWILVDSAASTHVCGPDHFPEVGLEDGIDPMLRTADGTFLVYHGKKRVPLWIGDLNLEVTFVVTNCRRIIVSAGMITMSL